MTSLPDPNQEAISLRKVEGGIAAIAKFSGKPTEDVVREEEKSLRSSLIRDGLKPKMGCLLARYNDPGRTWSFMLVRFKTHLYMHMILNYFKIASTFPWFFVFFCFYEFKSLDNQVH